jgi:hypothetical protein
METGQADPAFDLPALIDPVPANFVSPEHLLYVCNVYPCAATEPEVPADATPDPAVQTGAGGQGVRVLILDTGLVEGATTDHSWLAGVTGDRDDPFGPVVAGVRLLEQDGGHGTFTAGCLRAAAPQAQLHVVDATKGLTRKQNAVGTIGATYEGDLAQVIRTALTDPASGSLAVPHVLLVNFAGTTQDDRPPPGLTALYDDLLQHLPELVVVAPAGNEGDTTRNWPAAFPWVVGVGSLASDGHSRASFSNYGPTVDVWAPGADIVNAFARGQYEYVWPPLLGQPRATFAGMARWSGTSFAAPLVAGAIATRSSRTGQTSARAWLSLLALAESQAVPGTGPVLRPGQS